MKSQPPCCVCVVRTDVQKLVFDTECEVVDRYARVLVLMVVNFVCPCVCIRICVSAYLCLSAMRISENGHNSKSMAPMPMKLSKSVLASVVKVLHGCFFIVPF